MITLEELHVTRHVDHLTVAGYAGRIRLYRLSDVFAHLPESDEVELFDQDVEDFFDAPEVHVPAHLREAARERLLAVANTPPEDEPPEAEPPKPEPPEAEPPEETPPTPRARPSSSKRPSTALSGATPPWRMTLLQIAVLGQLVDGEISARDLRVRLEAIGYRQRDHASFYQMMNRLAEQGFVALSAGDPVAGGRRVRERSYALTDEGRRIVRLCRKWLTKTRSKT